MNTQEILDQQLALLDFWEEIESPWENHHRNRSDGQAVAIELWCEAEGVAPMLANVARKYGVSTFATGGFSSVTVNRKIALRAARRDRSTLFLHVGDYDPSGQSIFESMSEDAQRFFYQAGHWEEGFSAKDLSFDVERLALTHSQVAEYDLPTAPAKTTDSRSANWAGETCQLEAMAPSDLTSLVEGAIVARYDMEAFYANVEREARERERLREDWKSLMPTRWTS